MQVARRLARLRESGASCYGEQAGCTGCAPDEMEVAVNAAIQEKLSEAKHRPSPSVARALRLEANLSQQIVAEAVGVHRVTLARFELGRQHLRPQAAKRLAEILDEIQATVV